MTTADSAALGALAFSGTWRGYQQLALEAFEAGRKRGQQQSHIVAPPGSGKTLLGMELIRRLLGTRALVLAPNTAVQAQWLRTAGTFEPGRPWRPPGSHPPWIGVPYFTSRCASYR